MMKEIIKKAGYYEQLEILSESTDEGLNRLVYEIYEALDIQWVIFVFCDRINKW